VLAFEGKIWAVFTAAIARSPGAIKKRNFTLLG